MTMPIVGQFGDRCLVSSRGRLVVRRVAPSPVPARHYALRDGPAGRLPRLRRRLRGHAVPGRRAPRRGRRAAPARRPAAARGGGDPGRRAGRGVRHRAAMPCCSPPAATAWRGSTSPPAPWSSPAARAAAAGVAVRFVTGDALDLGVHAAALGRAVRHACSTSACSTSCSRTTGVATRRALASVVRPGGRGVRRGVERPEPVRDRAGAGDAARPPRTRSARARAGA